jgi:hypothetical protein
MKSSFRQFKQDGVAKTRQWLRCCDCLAASTYAGTPHGSTIARLAFGAFCLAIPFDIFGESPKQDSDKGPLPDIKKSRKT